MEIRTYAYFFQGIHIHTYINTGKVNGRPDSMPYAKDYDFLNSEYPRLKRITQLRKLEPRVVKWQGLSSWPDEECRSSIPQIFPVHHTTLLGRGMEFTCFVNKSHLSIVSWFSIVENGHYNLEIWRPVNYSTIFMSIQVWKQMCNFK